MCKAPVMAAFSFTYCPGIYAYIFVCIRVKHLCARSVKRHEVGLCLRLSEVMHVKRQVMAAFLINLLSIMVFPCIYCFVCICVRHKLAC